MAWVRDAETVLQPVDTNRAVAARVTVGTDFIGFIDACLFWSVLEALLFRIEERHCEAQPPVRPATARNRAHAATGARAVPARSASDRVAVLRKFEASQNAVICSGLSTFRAPCVADSAWLMVR